MNMVRKTALAVCLFVFVVLNRADARSIKVLIIDDIFQKIPAKGEQIERMGRLNGDLLVNGTHYLGNIELWRGKSAMYLINELPLEEYVKNVVSSEVGMSWDMEALKAQAVISRTYALYQVRQNNNNNYDLTSSVLHQVYKGNAIDARISYAVMTTAGEVLTYNDQIIEALYHSTCGGRTEAAEDVFGKSYPYLRPVESSCQISPYWIWERRIPREEIEKALSLNGIGAITPKAYTSTNRVKTVDITHSGGTLAIKTNDLRKAIGWSRLPSTNFTVTRNNGMFVFEGKGYGHGVGLCQWSALEMARNGKDYKEILAFFYPGSMIQLYEDR